MSFAEPLWLLTLGAAVPLGVGAAVLARRTRRRALRFAGAGLLAELVDGPKRHRLPAVLAVLSGLLLIGALAEPRVSATAGRERANVMLVIDVSGSMTATDIAPSRLSAAKAGAVAFVENLPENWRAGVVAFSDQAFVLSSPTDDTETLVANIQGLAAQGGTATGDALDLAMDAGRAGSAARLAEARERKDDLGDPSRTVVVVLSDGKQTVGSVTTDAAALRAQRLGIPIFTIAFGTDSGRISVAYPDGSLQALEVPPDLAASRRIAELSGGAFFTAVSGDELETVYRSVRGVLEREDVERDVSSYAALAALALVAAAAAVWLGVRSAP